MSWKKHNIWENSRLKSVLESNRLAQAYLFLGQDQQKKIWTAMSLAKSLFCSLDGADFCDQCPSCKKIEHHNHPDILWLRPVGASRTIKINTVRHLQSVFALKSFVGGKKLAFIIGADRMQEQAANALLKIIEEPQGNSLIVLMAENIEKLLPTIISRCQQIFFPLSPVEHIKEYLQTQFNADPEKAEFISVLSKGNFSLANRFFDDERRQWRDFVVTAVYDFFNDKSDVFAIVSHICSTIDGLVKKTISSDTSYCANEIGVSQHEAEELLSDMDKKALEKNILNQEVYEFFQFVEISFRDILIFQHAQDKKYMTNIDKISFIKKISKQYSDKVFYSLIDDVHNAYYSFCGNTKLEFVLEVFFLKLLNVVKAVS
ncbi:DNA polymerase III subunit [bacterium]|nr:DNA polymerase III subunit [bacterium]